MFNNFVEILVDVLVSSLIFFFLIIRLFISKALYVKAISDCKESEKRNKETKAKN